MPFRVTGNTKSIPQLYKNYTRSHSELANANLLKFEVSLTLPHFLVICKCVKLFLVGTLCVSGKTDYICHFIGNSSAKTHCL